jgi:hypothetical protein
MLLTIYRRERIIGVRVGLITSTSTSTLKEKVS